MALNPNALLTVSEAESFLEIAVGSDTVRLELLINGASNALEKHCSRYFVPRALTEIHSGDGTTELLLRRAPVVSIDNPVLRRDETAIPVADIYVDKDAGIIHSKEELFTEGVLNITVPYTAGYGTVAVPAVPADIKLAAIYTVVFFWKSEFIEFTEGLQQALQNLPTSAFPSKARDIIENYNANKGM